MELHTLCACIIETIIATISIMKHDVFALFTIITIDNTGKSLKDQRRACKKAKAGFAMQNTPLGTSDLATWG